MATFRQLYAVYGILVREDESVLIESEEKGKQAAELRNRIERLLDQCGGEPKGRPCAELLCDVLEDRSTMLPASAQEEFGLIVEELHTLYCSFS